MIGATPACLTSRGASGIRIPLHVMSWKQEGEGGSMGGCKTAWIGGGDMGMGMFVCVHAFSPPIHGRRLPFSLLLHAGRRDAPAGLPREREGEGGDV
jgi:hypothetical protein